MWDTCTDEQRQLFAFNFSAQQLYEDFRELSENSIKDNLRTVKDMLVAKFPSDHDEIQSQMASLEEFYLSQTKEPLEKFKEAAEEIFAVPANIIWSGDDEDINSTKPQELEELKKEVSDLERQYLQEVYDQACLKNELKKFEEIEPLYNKVNEVLKLLKSNNRPGQKTMQEMRQVLKTFEGLYYNKGNNVAESQVITDVFNLFKTV